MYRLSWIPIPIMLALAALILYLPASTNADERPASEVNAKETTELFVEAFTSYNYSKACFLTAEKAYNKRCEKQMMKINSKYVLHAPENITLSTFSPSGKIVGLDAKLKPVFVTTLVKESKYWKVSRFTLCSQAEKGWARRVCSEKV